MAQFNGIAGFNVGDWVVKTNGECFSNDERTLQITKIDDNGRCIWLSNGTIYLYAYLADLRLWTIADAKDGDVLADGDLPFIFKKIDTNKYCYAYCGISADDGFRIKSEGKLGEWTWMQDIKPATKEQRDTLFQKMKEAGYEWDAEKKELNRIVRTNTIVKNISVEADGSISIGRNDGSITINGLSYRQYAIIMSLVSSWNALKNGD